MAILRFQFLEQLIKKNQLKIGAELGLWKGRTYFHLLANCPGLTLYGVDEWRHTPERKKVPGGQTYQHWNMDGLRKHVTEGAKKYNGRAKILQMSTAAAAAQIPDGSLDFVFIDADHSENGVRQDIINWKPKIRPGGFLTGHDISWPTVRKVVDELVVNYKSSSKDSDAVWYAQL